MKKKFFGAMLVLFLAIILLPRNEVKAAVDLDNWTGAYTLTEDGTLTFGVTDELDLGNYIVPWEKDSVKKIVIPEGVTKIGYSSFNGYHNLTSVSIPEGVTSIGNYAFSYCENLTTVTIPTSVESIGASVFSNTGFLETATWQDGLFYSDHWLILADSSVINGAVVVADGTKGIAAGAFNACENLTSVTIPRGVKYIGDSTFDGCSSLTGVTLPESVIGIGNNAFNGCTVLMSVTIPDSVTSIGTDAFLNSGFYTTESNWDNGLLYSGKWLLKAKETVSGEVAFKTGTKGIAAGAFNGCSEITSVTIPEGTANIGNSTFSECSALTSVTIPEGVKSIESYAFSGCIKLADITIPASVKSIGNAAFYGCRSLTSVTIPEGVENIRIATFFECRKLANVTIPKSVKRIERSAFGQCESLTNVTIPEGVTSIGNSAFSGCRGLTEMTIPENVTSIGTRVFANCSSLSSVTILKGITCIKYGTFQNCGSLTSVTISDSVTSIEYDAFGKCGSLTSVMIPNSVTNIGASAFYECKSLTSVTIPASVTSIGERAFGYTYTWTVEDYQSKIIKLDGFSIKCYAGTAGETYAKENEINYELLKEETKPVDPTPENPQPADTNKTASDKIAAADKGSTVTVETAKTDKISKEVIAAAKEKGVALEIKSAADESGVSVVWKFGDIKNAIEFNPQVTVDAKVEAVTTALGGKDGKTVLPETTKVTQVSFAHDGDLPGEAEVAIPLAAEKYAEGSTAYLYYFDPAKKLFELIDSAKCTGGKAVFKMTHCSDYIVTNAEIPAELTVKAEAAGTTKTGDVNRMVYVVLMLAGLACCAGVVVKKKNWN